MAGSAVERLAAREARPQGRTRRSRAKRGGTEHARRPLSEPRGRCGGRSPADLMSFL